MSKRDSHLFISIVDFLAYSSLMISIVASFLLSYFILHFIPNSPVLLLYLSNLWQCHQIFFTWSLPKPKQQTDLKLPHGIF